jgi:CrcB protein
MKWVGLVAGGIAGTVARYVLAGTVYRFWGSDFPYGTLLVNLAGCLLIGFLSALAEDKLILGPNLRILLMAGFCGAFTTFSTFMYETAHLMRDGQTAQAFLNVAVSVIAGFFLFRLGVLIGDWV